jgi:predicted ATP-grasp superfamily ATP-dependent carboligase
MRPPVLVTDGDERAALAIVRSLGRAGHRVEVCSGSGRSLAGASRHAAVDHAVPDPLRRPDAFAGRIEALCREGRIGVLLPVTDAALMACLPLRERLAGVRLPFPEPAAHRAISDKLALTRRAGDMGIAVPGQLVLESPGAAPAADALPPFPLVVKPARSVVDGPGGRVKTHVRHATVPEDLTRILRSYPPEAYPLLLQERIRGSGEGVFLLLWEGRLVAAFAHRRLREKPPTGGVSVYRESIPLDPELRDRSVRLLESFGWTGVAMVEYKRATRDGRPYLMEVNGRFWGSLQLAVDAGVDFPRLLAALAAGESPDPVTAYRGGIRSRWWMGDLDHLLIRLRRPIEVDALPPGSASRLGAAFRFLIPWRPGDRSEVLRLSDPMPGLREMGRWLRDATGAGTPGARGPLDETGPAEDPPAARRAGDPSAASTAEGVTVSLSNRSEGRSRT